MSTNPPDMARWTVSVTKETDIALRAYLGAQGMRKGDISKFVEEAVRWRMFDRTVQQVRARNADLSPEELMALIDEACGEARMRTPAPGV